MAKHSRSTLTNFVLNIFTSVREYVVYVFFQISKKHDFLRFFK